MKKDNFWNSHKYLLLLLILNIIIDILVGYLYNINYEFILYIVAFTLIFWIIAMVITYKHYRDTREKYSDYYENNISEIKRSDEDKYWEIIREKEDFFTLWAHQIKTPIAALRALFDTSDSDTSGYKQELFKIENYVEMALNYIRFDTMSGDMVLEEIHIEALVKQLVKKFAPIFIHKHLSVKLENLDIKVLTDEKWFSFVLDQVLSNALKYTNEGQVTIKAVAWDDKNEIIISDTGIGIRQEDIPRLFEKGFTGYNGRFDKKASGLGLYLCKGVCNKLGHEISITSEVGKGTNVIISCKKDSLKKSNLTKM
ncbi:MAG: HAMP domain-containing histidine kinase [Eubacterium sp.]|nr:HAMP domain-containing histidine kinase [Eubacterium sp.]